MPIRSCIPMDPSSLEIYGMMGHRHGHPCRSVSLRDGWKEIRHESVFPDIAMTWKGKKVLRIRLEALNLLDRREYADVLLSPLLEESYRLKIRPLTVILGADWQF